MFYVQYDVIVQANENEIFLMELLFLIESFFECYNYTIYIYILCAFFCCVLS